MNLANNAENAPRLARETVRLLAEDAADHPQEAHRWLALAMAQLRIDDLTGARASIAEAYRIDPIQTKSVIEPLLQRMNHNSISPQ